MDKVVVFLLVHTEKKKKHNPVHINMQMHTQVYFLFIYFIERMQGRT